MNTKTENLLVAARDVVCDFEEWGEVLQLADNDDDGMYGPDSAIMRLAAAVKTMAAEKEVKNEIRILREFVEEFSPIHQGQVNNLSYHQLFDIVAEIVEVKNDS